MGLYALSHTLYLTYGTLSITIDSLELAKGLAQSFFSLISTSHAVSQAAFIAMYFGNLFQFAEILAVCYINGVAENCCYFLLRSWCSEKKTRKLTLQYC